MSSRPDESSLIAAAAARWVARKDRDFTPDEARAFNEWLAADPRHREEWRSLSDSWDALDELPVCGELVAATARLDRDTRRRLWLRRRFAVVSAAAAVLVIGFVLFEPLAFLHRDRAVAPTVVRREPEAHRHMLPDGSVVEARGDAVVTVYFSEVLRRVQLKRGEAYFTVAHDAARPFVVETDGVAVRAVGTAFVVRLDSAGVDVLVAGGKVRVRTSSQAELDTAPLIEAGSAVRIAAAGGPTAVEQRPIEPGELERALVWRSPMLEFSRAPLDEVMAAFREYAPHRVTLGDPALRQHTVSGLFEAGNIDGFLRLAESFGLRVLRKDDGDVVLLRANP